jgi:hypothetical protein
MSICENSKEEALDVRNIYHKVKKYLALNFDKERGQVHLKTKQMAHRKNKLDRQRARCGS